MTQALHLANGATVNEKLRDPNSAVAKAIASKGSNAAILHRLFLAALTRKPTESERQRPRKNLGEAGAEGRVRWRRVGQARAGGGKEGRGECKRAKGKVAEEKRGSDGKGSAQDRRVSSTLGT